ncbi:MAG: NnrS family protein [Xanthobacteraceae bacterium]
MPIPRLRPFNGPALFSYGFRPFFLFGAFYAGAVLLLWLPMFEGRLGLPTGLSPTDWHVHEMLYGYIAAIVTGFLLTAIPNWTGRLPLNGLPLIVLFALWVVGRIAVAFSDMIGWAPAALLDIIFLFVVLAAAGREIVAGENWRNLRVLAIVAILALTNVGYHLEAHWRGDAAYSRRLAFSAILLLVMLIGGRIIPSFTRNWLVKQNPGRLPAPFDRIDALSIAGGTIALAAWTIFPDAAATGLLLIAAGLIHAARLVRWAGDRTGRDPLVLILHVAYAFVPIGFLLTGAAALSPSVPATAGFHAWSVGAIGTMTLAVMTRASRGHTGRTLEAPFSTQVLFAAIIISALLRISAALLPDAGQPLLWVAGIAWVAAFWGFCAVYGPMLMRPRLKG